MYCWQKLLSVLIMTMVCHTAAQAADLFSAAKEGSVSTVMSMVVGGADVDARDEAGRTPLMIAASADEWRTVELLLNLGADINARDKDGSTALMLAAGKGHRRMADLLLQNGGNPDLKNHSGKTLLDYAKIGDIASTDALSFGSMLRGKNHREDNLPAAVIYLPLKGRKMDADAFKDAAVRACLRKGWSVTHADASRVQAFYARAKAAQLFKAEIVLEPTRIAVRYLPGFGNYAERTYLDAIKVNLAHELALY